MTPSLTPFGRWQTGRNPRAFPDLTDARAFFSGLLITHDVLPSGAGAVRLAQSAPAFALSLHGTITA